MSEGVLLSYKQNLHSRNITAIVCYSPLKYLLTAAKDGTSNKSEFLACFGSGQLCRQDLGLF